MDFLESASDIVRAPFDAFYWFLDQVFLVLRELFERFGIPIVFLAALAEATVALGLVLPGVVMMFLGGAYAAEREISLAAIFAVAFIGTAIGDAISYSLGRWGSERLERTRLGPSLRLGRALLEGRGRWFIPFYHLHSWSRAVGPFGAGALRLPLRVWWPLDLLGAALSSTLWVGAGAIFGTAVLTEDGRLEQHPLLRIGLAVAAVTWFVLVARAVDRRRTAMREAEAHVGEPVDLDAADGAAPAEERHTAVR